MRSLIKQLPLFTLCLGFFMVILDASVVNVALPSIRIGLAANISDLQWVIAGYTLTFSCFLLLSGYFSDQVGARKTLLIGLSFFLLTSLACGLAMNIEMLIFFRLLQGASASALVPSSLALINASYPDARERAWAIGIWGGMGGIAAASGPVLGAVLTADFGWRAVFLINIPVALLAIILSFIALSETARSKGKKFDFLGLVLGVGAVASLAIVLIELGRYTFSSPFILLPLFIFVLSLTFFIYFENRIEHPMFPLVFFKNRGFSIAMIVGVIINIGLYGTLFILPLYFHHVRGYSILFTGLAVLPLLILIAIASYFSGKLASVKGPKLPIKIGFMIGFCAFFSLIPIAYFGGSYLLMILPLAGIGFGVAFIMPAATIVAIQSAPPERSGIASGAFTTCRQMGSLIGVALFGTIISLAGHFVLGMNISLLIAGLLFVLGLIVSFSLRNVLGAV